MNSSGLAEPFSKISESSVRSPLKEGAVFSVETFPLMQIPVFRKGESPFLTLNCSESFTKSGSKLKDTTFWIVFHTGKEEAMVPFFKIQSLGLVFWSVLKIGVDLWYARKKTRLRRWGIPYSAALITRHSTA